MPQITAIRLQKNKNRANIFLDHKFGFGVDFGVFEECPLKVGDELAQEKIDRLKNTSEYKTVLGKLIRFISVRPRSITEVNLWLKRKKISESYYKDLFTKVNQLELLDDSKFAQWWVGQRMDFRPKSKRVLVNELKQKGIDQNIIEDVLSKVEIDEVKLIKQTIEKNQYRFERFDEKTKNIKLSQYLLRKGFPWDKVKTCVKITGYDR